MSAVIGALRVNLGMNSAAFSKGADEASRRMAKMSKSMDRMGRKMRRIGRNMSLALTAPMIGLAYKSVAAQGAQEQAIAAVDAALDSMGQRAGFTSSQLQGMASSLQAVSLYGDEDILKKVTANLLTFGNISEDVFVRAQEVALDLSARLGQDLQSSAVMLGKALNDPVKGLTALSRVGVSFTEQQQDQIKAMAKAGDVAGAQALMLAELEKQYKGQAQALANTDSGKITQAWNSIGDAMESVGAIILPIMADMAVTVKGMAESFQSLSPATQKFVVIAGSIAAVLGPAIIAFGLVFSSLGAILPVLAAVAGAISLPVVAIAALAAGAVWLGVKISNVVKSIGGFGEALKLIKEIALDVWGRIGDGGSIMANKLSIVWANIKRSFLTLIEYLQKQWADFLHKTANGMRDIPALETAFIRVKTAAIAAQTAFYTTREQINNLGDGVKELTANNAVLAAGMAAPIEGMEGLRTAVFGATDAAEEGSESAAEAVDGVTDAVGQAADAVDDLGDRFTVAAKPAKALVKEFSGVEKAFDGLFDAIGRGDVSGGFSGLWSDLSAEGGSQFSDLLTGAFEDADFSILTTGLSDALSGTVSNLSSLFSGGGLGALTGAISSFMPVLGAFQAVVGLFKGFSTKTTLGAGIDLGITDGGIAGGTFETVQKKTFWGLFSSTKTKVKAFEAETFAALQEQVENVQAVVADTYAAAGVSVTDAMFAGVNLAVERIDTRDLSAEEIEEKVNEIFAEYGDALSDAIGGVSLEIAAVFADVKAILEPAGQIFYGAFEGMATAASNLAGLFGGVDALGGAVNGFVETFFSEAEQFQIRTDQVASTFADLGLVIPTTNEAFKALVLSQDLMTEAGREAYSALVQLGPVFDEITGRVGNLTEAFSSDTGNFVSDFDARLAQISEARGYSVDQAVTLSGGVKQYGLLGDLRQLAEGQASMTERLLDTFESWQRDGLPVTGI